MALFLRFLACRLVGERDDARAEGMRGGRLEGRGGPVLEEPLPVPKDDGVDHEPELVDQVVLDQRLGTLSPLVSTDNSIVPQRKGVVLYKNDSCSGRLCRRS